MFLETFVIQKSVILEIHIHITLLLKSVRALPCRSLHFLSVPGLYKYFPPHFKVHNQRGRTARICVKFDYQDCFSIIQIIIRNLTRKADVVLRGENKEQIQFCADINFLDFGTWTFIRSCY